MTTASDIVTKALQKVGVVAKDEAASAEDMADGLFALNAMIHSWKLRGVDLSHADLAATDTFSLAAEYEEGTIYLLASRLSPDYEVPPRFDADDWFRTFQAANLTIDKATFDKAVTRPPSYYTPSQHGDRTGRY